MSLLAVPTLALFHRLLAALVMLTRLFTFTLVLTR